MLAKRKTSLYLDLHRGVAWELMIPCLGHLILLVGVFNGRRQLLGLA